MATLLLTVSLIKIPQLAKYTQDKKQVGNQTKLILFGILLIQFLSFMVFF